MAREGTDRLLTQGEINLAQSVFGSAIDYRGVRICQRKWIFFQPRNTVMAPMGHIHFHPRSATWSPDFAGASLPLQGLFIHEMVHVWQYQTGVFLPLKRHPFCRYDYAIKPGWRLEKYGLEQQAEIVRHAFMIGQGASIPGAPEQKILASILPF